MFFLLYTLLLLLGGIAMVAVGVAVKEQGKGSRILNVVIGLAFFGYGFYLLFLFDGDRYRIFFYVFVLPILLIVRAVKARKEAREQAAAQQFAGGPSFPGGQQHPSGQQYPGGQQFAGGPQQYPGGQQYGQQQYPGGQQQPGTYPGTGHGQPGQAFPPAPGQPAQQGWHPTQPNPQDRY
ncbi:hypothetical protein [Micromonospora sp. C28ISP2-4]|uniref:hypothetical protein n=1 Tax=Micromonospora sp. C28ISP2-4 TaxID=3059523 RepID=UPI0026758FC3|nr:hypothetical protein [Micromonospora sp. C28ISP2-4]MDO3687309.1 hypothetical protein [Micromonospora sp. C28ISP2-4]